MKLTSVNSTTINNNNYKNNRANNPSFKGGIDVLTGFWQFVDNGGKAVQFTVEDMCGTNIPRTYKGAMAGYKYTHKINVPALLQEAVREFLTGPIMTITPWAIISYCMSKYNKTSDTHVENIRNLSDIMETVQSGAVNDVEREFFYRNAADVLQSTVGKEIVSVSQSADDLTVADVENFANKIGEYSQAAKNTIGKKGKAAKEAAAAADNAKTAVTNAFEQITKRTKNAYHGASFLNASYTKATLEDGTKQIGSTGVGNYIDYMVNYAQDFTKANSDNGIVKITKQTVEKFKNFNTGKRLAIVASMFFITGVAMSFIPKLYTMVSGSTDPNATAIYDEAGKGGKKEGGAE